MPTSKKQSAKKGTVIAVSSPQSTTVKSKIRLMSSNNGGLNELRRYNNGSIGAFFKNGKFRFITGGNNLKPRAKGQKINRPKISPRSAVIALQKYYRNRDYKTKSSRQGALTRRLCSDNKPHTDDSRFKVAPHRYEYKGITDGARCPPGKTVYKKRQLSDRQKKSLRDRLKLKQSGGGENTYKDNSMNRRLNRVGSPYKRSRSRVSLREGKNHRETNARQHQRQQDEEQQHEQQNQQEQHEQDKQSGGKRPVSLKTAVSLLRQYYEEKYGGGYEDEVQ
jgi:hypothetical protein